MTAAAAPFLPAEPLSLFEWAALSYAQRSRNGVVAAAMATPFSPPPSTSSSQSLLELERTANDADDDVARQILAPDIYETLMTFLTVYGQCAHCWRANRGQVVAAGVRVVVAAAIDNNNNNDDDDDDEGRVFAAGGGGGGCQCCLSASHAAEQGHIECLQWHHRRNVRVGALPFEHDTTELAAQNGHLACLKYAHEHGAVWQARTTSAAAANGQFECLVYAHKAGCPWDHNTTWKAARYGHLACLIYAHEHGCPWTTLCTRAAAEGGHYECLVYAWENGCPWNADTVYAAAKGGSLECLTYAHENGCEWDYPPECTAIAAFYGHLACLQYAHEHGSGWAASTTYWAVIGGQYDCLVYADTHGCPWDDQTSISAHSRVMDNDHGIWEYCLCHDPVLQYAQHAAVDQYARRQQTLRCMIMAPAWWCGTAAGLGVALLIHLGCGALRLWGSSRASSESSLLS